MKVALREYIKCHPVKAAVGVPEELQILWGVGGEVSHPC